MGTMSLYPNVCVNVHIQKYTHTQMHVLTKCPGQQEWAEASVDELLGHLDACPKPALIYCKTGARATALGVAQTATRSRFFGGKFVTDAERLSDEQKKLLDTVC